MSRFVVDASVLAKLFFPEDHSEKTERLLKNATELSAPDLLWAEVASIAWKRVGRGAMDATEAATVLEEMLRFPVHTVPCGTLSTKALSLAITTGRTVYDCLYLALAVENQCTLITADEKFVNSLRGTPFARIVRWIGA